jgi:hypothetical protein
LRNKAKEVETKHDELKDKTDHRLARSLGIPYNERRSPFI